MLEPDNRHLLVEALRPPTGMALDQVIATTFTLDLEALLMAPVAFALFDGEDSDNINPLALLEALRRHANRITVFCQAGAIAVPKKLTSMAAWLEQSVVPVKPPPGHLFHPKLWALTFSNEQGESATRLLISSRNLTFDNSWDTFVRLDGTPSAGLSGTMQKRTAKVNAPLVALLRSLPGMAIDPIDDARNQAVSELIDTVSTTQWERPDDARLKAFWPLGIEGAKQPRLTGERVMTISPFLGASTLEALTGDGTNHILLSRAESMDDLGAEALAGYTQLFVLDADEPPETDNEDGSPTGPANTSIGAQLNGLHAKVYITERGEKTRLFFGSANASASAFNGNVELLVEFVTERNDLTIDSILGDETKNKSSAPSLRDLLLPYEAKPKDDAEPDPVEQATRELQSKLQRLSAQRFDLAVTPANDGRYGLTLSWQGAFRMHKTESLTARLASLPTDTARPIGETEHELVIGDVDELGLSSFIVLQLSTKVEGEPVSVSTLVNAHLIGEPVDRHARIVNSLVKNKDDLLRYLLFLLHEVEDGGDLSKLAAGLTGAGDGWDGANQAPILESLLSALTRGGHAIERVADLLEDLEQIGGDEAPIPDELIEVWTPIFEVWQEQQRKAAQ